MARENTVNVSGLKATAAILSTVGFSILAVPTAQAKCATSWVVPHGKTIDIKQGNFDVSFLLEQDKVNVLTGSGKYSGVTGNVSEGSIHGGAFRVVMNWSNGSVGEYTGAIDDFGKLEDGRVFDQKHPANWSKWTSKTVLGCRS
jgi:hypothetical protein